MSARAQSTSSSSPVMRWQSGWANCSLLRYSLTVPANSPQAPGTRRVCRWLKKTSFIVPAPSPTVTSVRVPRRCFIGRLSTDRTWASTVTRSPTCRSSRRVISPRLA